MKLVFESKEPITLKAEDSGMALLVDQGEPEGGGDPDVGMWVRIGSYDADRNHTEIKSLVDKRVRVTVEVLD